MADILLVSDDVVGARMAGPGIRAWELARVLGRRFKVSLAVPDSGSGGSAADAEFIRGAPFEMIRVTASRPGDLLAKAEASRIVIVQGYVLSKFPGLGVIDRPLVADIYDPFVLENLFIHQGRIPSLADREAVHLHDLGVFNGLLRRGDHFLVASDRQRDLVTGALLALDRIGPEALDAGADLAHLLSVVPFGIDVSDASDRGPGRPRASADFRALFPQISDDDLLLLWGGVLSDWYDPATLLAALAAVRAAEPRLKLLFLSTGHPNALLPAWDAVIEARRLADELGLTASGGVIFHDGWIEYRRRGEIFRRADIGVSIHRTHFETRYAFRTRMLDYLKHGLPIVATEGDVFAGLIETERLGRVVRSGDVEGLARALAELAADPAERAAVRARCLAVRERFDWETAAEPLVRWCGRTLEGSVHPLRRPGRDDLVRACAGPAGSRFRDRLKTWLGPAGRRLPMRIQTKLRRIWKG